MTTTTGNNGRLGNQIIRNLAVSLIAEKSGLKVDYSSESVIKQLGIYLFSGEKVYNTTKTLNDDNYFEVYNAATIHYNLNPNQAYFQTKEITNMLYRYLRKPEIQDEIVMANPFRPRYKANRDVFVHVRLTDAARFNPGADYYLRAIGAISALENLYISTDDANHRIIQTIVSKYPNAKIVKLDEIKTFKFASTCAHIVLSHGSFSAVIGYLAYYSDVYYPEYESDKMWYGDMFSIDGWRKIKST